jgi:hypothetical protein
MNPKLTITISKISQQSHVTGHVPMWLSFLMVGVLSACGASGTHRTSSDQIKMVTERVSKDSDLTCRPYDADRMFDYVWISTDKHADQQRETKNLRISRFRPLGKSGYEHRELINLSDVEAATTEDSFVFKTGRNTWGSFDTEYDFSTQTTLLEIQESTMIGRLRVKGYAGNLAVYCTQN